jgi:hypothetical protein
VVPKAAGGTASAVVCEPKEEGEEECMVSEPFGPDAAYVSEVGLRETDHAECGAGLYRTRRRS